MICNLFLGMCIVGLVQTGPSTYLLQTLTDNGVIRSYVVHEADYCYPAGVFMFDRSSTR